jgi:putative restriction endonuclease
MATWAMLRTVAVDPDLALRQAAITQVLDLRDAYGDFVPRDALREGFIFRGERVSFSSFQKGIHRARQMRGPAALSLFTTPPKEGRAAPYADEVDVESGLIIYHYRAGSIEQADNRALRAAHELRTPLIYFKGVAPSRYFPIAPVSSPRMTLLNGLCCWKWASPSSISSPGDRCLQSMPGRMPYAW